MEEPKTFSDHERAVDWLFDRIPGEIVMATPLGLGKPNELINSIYARACIEPKRQLRIFTALSLGIPDAKGFLQRRFLMPFIERQWGSSYPELTYLKDLEQGQLPRNVRVHEFYLQAGRSLDRPAVQRDYICVNYTHVPYAILDQDVNVIVQLIAKHPTRPGLYSLSCNPDLTLDVVDYYRKMGRKIFIIGVVHPELPYCGSDAEVPTEFFSALVETNAGHHRIFALPRQPVDDADFMIGLYGSLLIEDGGTLQIGIGSLAEALVYCTILRHTRNEIYRAVVSRLLELRPLPEGHGAIHLEPFREGLYGTSEMVMDGFMHLHRAGILKRTVTDLGQRFFLHGAFFLGSSEFYGWMRERSLGDDGQAGVCMTRVSKVNDLYDADEIALRRQRVKARFFNTCMSATLLGGAASDTNEEGKVISGVGGQYNFVAMSHELPDSSSVLMLRSTRRARGRLVSNFVWGHGQLTIPRHLRDIVISEYGIAWLKNKTDEQVIQCQLRIVDDSFSEGLRSLAQTNGKLSASWSMTPPGSKVSSNRSSFASEFFAEWREHGHFATFPFGSDFTPVEERLVMALSKLRRATIMSLIRLTCRGMRTPVDGKIAEALSRMSLTCARSAPERLWRWLLIGALV